MKIEQNTGIAIYSKKDYERLLEISDDREIMNDTWKEWQIKKNEFKRNFSKFGMKVTEVKIDIDQLVLYCKLRGIPNNGASRAQFVQ